MAERGRQPSRLERGERAGAYDDGGGRRNVGVDTGARHDAGGAPAAVGRQAGRRVDDVVEDDAASSPAPYGGAGGGDPSRLDPDGLLRLVDRGGAGLVRLDRPALVWLLPRDRHVTTH